MPRLSGPRTGPARWSLHAPLLPAHGTAADPRPLPGRLPGSGPGTALRSSCARFARRAAELHVVPDPVGGQRQRHRVSAQWALLLGRRRGRRSRLLGGAGRRGQPAGLRGLRHDTGAHRRLLPAPGRGLRGHPHRGPDPRRVHAVRRRLLGRLRRRGARGQPDLPRSDRRGARRRAGPLRGLRRRHRQRRGRPGRLRRPRLRHLPRVRVDRGRLRRRRGQRRGQPRRLRRPRLLRRACLRRPGRDLRRRHRQRRQWPHRLR